MNDEILLTGGAVNRVTRRGEVVYRSGGPWVPAVHALLEHLNKAGFGLAPQPLGVAPDGREMITFLPGEVMLRPWRDCMFTDAALEAAGHLLRRLHAATEDLVFPPDTVWRSRVSGKQPGQIIRHGDLGPWNTLWEGTTITGLIDWDFAEPGERLTDIAQMALYFVPLRGDAHAAECGFTSITDLPHRLGVLCAAYGHYTPLDVVREIERLQLASVGEIEQRAAEGRYPWTMFRDNGEIDRTLAEVVWLRNMFPTAFPATPADPSRAAS